MEQSPVGNGSYELNRLTWPEVRSHLERDPRLILPVGAMDHHGLHLPLGANTLVAERVAHALSARLRTLVAPTFHYGLINPERTAYPGTGTLRRKTFHRAINELLASWDDHRVTEVIIITAQRYEPHLEALLTSLTASATTQVVDLMTIEVGDLIATSAAPERGGELETSLLLYLAPELVHRDQDTEPADDTPAQGRYVHEPDSSPHSGPPQGRAGNDVATAEKGRAVFERYVDVMEAALRQSETGEP